MKALPTRHNEGLPSSFQHLLGKSHDVILTKAHFPNLTGKLISSSRLVRKRLFLDCKSHPKTSCRLKIDTNELFISLKLSTFWELVRETPLAALSLARC